MGPLDRARANTRALETLHRLRDTGAEPTADDARTLAAYTGWGGQPDAFRRDFSHMPGWQDVNARLRSLMSDDEYEQAAASTRSPEPWTGSASAATPNGPTPCSNPAAAPATSHAP